MSYNPYATSPPPIASRPMRYGDRRLSSGWMKSVSAKLGGGTAPVSSVGCSGACSLLLAFSDCFWSQNERAVVRESAGSAVPIRVVGDSLLLILAMLRAASMVVDELAQSVVGNRRI